MELKKIIGVLNILKKNHYQAYVVGGTARDIILSRPFTDIDIASNAPIDFLKKSFKIESTDGEVMGSIKIVYQNVIMEITRFREEKYTNNSTFPIVTKYLNSPYDEASRRDFTINCLYLDLITIEIIDPFNGLNDLMQANLAFIGEPSVRIKEDPSRILRGLRLAYKLNFKIASKTNEAFKEYKDELNRLSLSKFKKEINKTVADLGYEKTKKILEEYQIDDKGVLENEH